MQEIVERLDRIEARLAAPPRAYLPVAEAAEFMGLSKQQLDLWRMKGGGPAFHRVGRKCLYSSAEQPNSSSDRPDLPGLPTEARRALWIRLLTACRSANAGSVA